MEAPHKPETANMHNARSFEQLRRLTDLYSRRSSMTNIREKEKNKYTGVVSHLNKMMKL